jgi:hypothetical protein
MIMISKRRAVARRWIGSTHGRDLLQKSGELRTHAADLLAVHSLAAQRGRIVELAQ